MRSKRFVVEIYADNEAFDGDDGVEIARMLHALAERVADSPYGKKTLLDVNGNTSGFANFIWKEGRRHAIPG